jgi:hypothetical protein
MLVSPMIGAPADHSAVSVQQEGVVALVLPTPTPRNWIAVAVLVEAALLVAE